MILGIGIDTVEIARFAHWHTYDQKKLLKIFSQSEIEYCLSVPTKSAERFAVRFATREALFKAYSAWQPNHRMPFLTFCKAVTIVKQNSIPSIILNEHLPACRILLSLSHSNTIATAFVILEQIDCK